MLFDDGVHMRLARRPLPRHDHDRQRRRGARLVRGVAPDGVARAARALHLGDGAVGDGRGRRAALARRARRAGAGPRRLRGGFRFMDIRDGGRRGPARRASAASRFSGELAYEINVPAWEGLATVGGGDGRRRAARDHALRDRDDARAARGEGLRDRRAGDRRHGDAAGRGPGVDDRQGQARLRRQALAPARGRAARRPQAARRAPARGAAAGGRAARARGAAARWSGT